MQPDNAIMGDAHGIDLPEAVVNEEDLVIEKNMARFSKTKEWKLLKQHLEGRIEFYQHKLPNGLEVGLDTPATAEDWRVANRVIGELRLIISTYENAKQVVEDAGRQNP
jgi:hypothetical protein